MADIEHIDAEERLDSLSEEWTALLSESGSDNLFLTWEWLRTWWRHLAGRRRLALLAVRSGGELLALAPLVARDGGLGRLLPTLELMGTGTVGSDYLDVIVRRGREAEAFEALARELRRSKTALVLRQLPAGVSQAAELAARLGETRWTVNVETTDVCPFISLVGHTWDSYLESLGSEHRYNVRRRLRGLQRAHEVRFETARSEPQRREILAALFDLHRRCWQGRGGSEAFGSPEILSFHETFSRMALDRGWLRLHALRVDGAPVAALLGYRYRGTFYFYQSGWDTAWARRSVGLVNLSLAIRDALEDGALEFDLLHGDEAYKFLWTRRTRELVRVEAYPPSPAGFAVREVVRAGRTARRVVRRVLPKALVDVLASARRATQRRRLSAAPAR